MAGPVGNRPVGLDIGVTDIRHWRRDDEVHLPDQTTSGRSPFFLPETRPLDAILKRPNLDERLALDVVPDRIDPDLLAPAAISETRQALSRTLHGLAQEAGPEDRARIEAAVTTLETEIALDEEVRAALAALLRG